MQTVKRTLKPWKIRVGDTLLPSGIVVETTREEGRTVIVNETLVLTWDKSYRLERTLVPYTL